MNSREAGSLSLRLVVWAHFPRGCPRRSWWVATTKGSDASTGLFGCGKGACKSLVDSARLRQEDAVWVVLELLPALGEENDGRSTGQHFAGNWPRRLDYMPTEGSRVRSLI